jgi:alanyl-tRNA synthetase
VDVLVAEMGDAYPSCGGRDMIVQTVKAEEERFDAVLTAGLPRLEEVLDRAAAAGGVVPGDEAFRLYDSLGVPLDFMEDLAGQRGLAIDRDGYERAMEGQREKARAGSAFKGGGKGITFTMPTPTSSARWTRPATVRRATSPPASAGVPVLALFDESGASVDELAPARTRLRGAGETPFYLEAGGQVSDTGRIFGGDGEATVSSGW